METTRTAASKAIIKWIPVAVFILLAAGIRLRSTGVPDYYLLAGSDGPYYPLQVRSLLEHSRLAMPDMPLLFILDGLLAKIFQLLHVASAQDSILLAIRAMNVVLPPLAAVPVFLIARELRAKPPALIYLIVAFSILSFTPLVLFSNSVLQKNALAVVPVFLYLYAVLRFLRCGRRKDLYYALVLLLLTALTHYGSFGLLTLFSLLVVLFRFGGQKSRLSLAGWRTAMVAVLMLVLGGGLIVIFDPARFQRLISAPLNVFRAPVILFALHGQHVVLTGYTLTNLIVVSVLALFALILIIAYRRRLSGPDKALALALAVLSLVLSCPFFGLEYAHRLFMLSYIPLSVLYLFVFTEFRSVWIQMVPAALFSLMLVFSVGTALFDRRPVSITEAAFTEFKRIDSTVRFTPHSLVIARQDLRLLASWSWRTRQSADYLFSPDDFGKYDAVYLVRQTDGSNLTAARYQQPDIPAGSSLSYKGRFFEVFRLAPGAGWNPVHGRFLLARGTIAAIQGIQANRILLTPQKGTYSSTVDISSHTILHLREGTQLRVGMPIEVWGDFEPFSLTIDAATINEGIE